MKKTSTALFRLGWLLLVVCTPSFFAQASLPTLNLVVEAVEVASASAAPCVNALTGSTISASVSGNNTSAGYTTIFALTTSTGSIISTNSTGSFTAPSTAGTYNIYAVNYLTTVSPQPTFVPGTSITAIGGSCSAISQPKCFNITTAPTSCTAAFVGGTLTATIAGNNTSVGYATTFALTDVTGKILAVSNTPSFSAPTTPGTYNIYAINYLTTASPQPNITAGVFITNIGGSCTAVSSPKCFSVSNCLPPTVAVDGASSKTICSGQSATLTATNCSGTVTWNTGAVVSQITVSPTTTTTYNATCTSNGCTSASSSPVVVTVVNCAKIYAFNDANTTPINTTVSGYVLTNDVLGTGVAPLVVPNIVSQPTLGTVTISSTGAYIYTPSLNAIGTDSFQYRVCDSSLPAICDTATVFIDIYPVTTTASNDKPLALIDINSTTKGVSISGNVLVNDIEPDAGQMLTATLLSTPTNGTLSFSPSTGQYTYTPNSGFVGEDTFTYRVCDNGTPQLCDNATVQIIVRETPLAGTNLPPVAADDQATTASGVPVNVPVLLNDKDPENSALFLTTTPTTQPTNGTVQYNSTTNSFTYTPAPGFVGTDSFIYKVCDNGTPQTCSQATAYIQVTSSQVAVMPKAYLQGALFGVVSPNTLMRDDLRVKNLIPLTSPYPSLGYTESTPTPSMAPSVLAITGNDAIVDWVFVELRSATAPSSVLASRSALIQRDGDIVDVDGVSPVTFSSAQPASYFVAVKHRNHLGVMTKSPLALNALASIVDFRQAITPTFTLSTSVIDQAQVGVQQGVAMWAGNALPDNKVIYQGTSNDVNTIYQLIINTTANVLVTPFFKLKAYSRGDINMNGEVVFQGTGNDIEYIYLNVIKNHFGNGLKQNNFIIREQLPQ